MKIISFDQSTKVVAYSVMNSKNNKLISYGKKTFDKLDNFDETIFDIISYIKEIIKKEKPEVFAIEDIQYQMNAKVFKVLAELMGAIKYEFYLKEYLYMVVPSNTWKSFCGIKGRKRKEQKDNSIAFIKEKFQIDVTEDEADAINIGLYMCELIKKKLI